MKGCSRSDDEKPIADKGIRMHVWKSCTLNRTIQFSVFFEMQMTDLRRERVYDSFSSGLYFYL